MDRLRSLNFSSVIVLGLSGLDLILERGRVMFSTFIGSNTFDCKVSQRTNERDVEEVWVRMLAASTGEMK